MTALGVLMLLTWALLQFWLFPQIDRYRPDIVRQLESATGRRIELASLAAGWDGVNPHLTISGLSVYDPSGAVSLQVARAEASLSWLSAILLEPRFARLQARGPQLALERDSAGVIRFAGFALNQGPSDSRFGNWLLQQGRLEVQDGELSWLDKVRAAPPLRLKQMQLQLDNFLGQHEFKLSLSPPAALGKPFLLQGTAEGGDIAQLAKWHGQFEVHLPDIDLAAWRAWLPAAIDWQQGQGAAHLFAHFQAGRVVFLAADLALADISVRLSPELALLQLPHLKGQFSWRWPPRQVAELKVTGLEVATAGGAVVDNAPLTLQLEANEAGGQLQAGAWRLAPLSALLPALPLPEALRPALAELQLAGSVDHVDLRWQGAWSKPSDYQLKLNFQDVALQQSARLPGVGKLEGQLTLAPQHGALQLSGKGVLLAAPALFLEPLRFDQLDLQGRWRKNSDGQWEVDIAEAKLANADVQAEASGKYRTQAAGPGWIDLDMRVPRAEARHIYRYVPLQAGIDTVQWLKQSLLAGQAGEGKGKLRGELAKFPFDDGGGEFRVEAKARAVSLDYAAGWPQLEAIDAKLLFSGDRMEVHAEQGRYGGVRIGATSAIIPALSRGELLQIEGQATGPAQEFVRYMRQSPLNDMLDAFPERLTVSQDGALKLALDIPLLKPENSKVNGSFQLNGNRVELGPDIPPLEAVQGLIGFSESGLSIRQLTAEALGGHSIGHAMTGADGQIQIDLHGNAQLPALAAFYQLPLGERLHGGSDYKATIKFDAGRLALNVESLGQGAGVNLPAPLGKGVAEIKPFRLQIKQNPAGEERWVLNYDKVLHAKLVRQAGGKGAAFERAIVQFGEVPDWPQKKGVYISGAGGYLDLDGWLLLKESLNQDTAAKSEATPLTVDGVDLAFARVSVAEHLLKNVQIKATPQQDGWQAQISCREFGGKLSWDPQGRGHVFARLDYLNLPLPLANRPNIGGGEESGLSVLPSLDVVVDDFRVQRRKLGVLQLKAVQQRENWLIDKLSISNPDGQLAMQGVWRSLGVDDFTTVKVNVESNNIGQLLSRFGYPDAVRRGSGKLDGQLSWRGMPMQPDFTSMSGNVSLQLERGQFAQLEPGVGRLLGILSLQSLSRRVRLDFRDVFSEGFAFDKISGDSQMAKGVLSTDNLLIIGPAAHILFRGSADVGLETQNIGVRIVPTIGDNVAVAAVVANPVVGVTAFLLSRALKDPIGQLIAYEYHITGTWRDPKIEQLGLLPRDKEGSK